MKNKNIWPYLNLLILVLINLTPTKLKAIFCGSNHGFAYDNNLIWNYKISPSWNDEGPNKQFCLVKAGINMEYGFKGHGRNKDNERVNIAQVFSPSESYLHSMDNSTDVEVATSQIEKLFRAPFFITDSTGKVLHYSLKVEKIQNDLNFWFSIDGPQHKNGQLAFSFYMPLKFVSLKKFEATQLPLPSAIQTVINAVPAVKNELDNLEQLALLNLAGLQLNDWENDKIWGDAHLLLSWNKTVSWMGNPKSLFNLFGQVGVTLPAADARDPQAAFAIPRGNDNSIGCPISIGLHAAWDNMVRASVFGDILISAAESSRRRLRKSAAQTELLISDKVLAKKKPGLVSRVTALLELKTDDDIFSGLVAWQFLYKKADKILSIDTPGYDLDVVNASERWQKQYFHTLIFMAGIDFKCLTKSVIAPKLAAFYKAPLAGKRVEMFHQIGLNLSMNF